MVKNHFKKALGIASITGFVFSLYSLSSNMTGNTIGSAGSASTNAAGIIVLIVSFLLACLAVKE